MLIAKQEIVAGLSLGEIIEQPKIAGPPTMGVINKINTAWQIMITHNFV